MNPRVAIALSASLLAFSGHLTAQVTEWHFFKEAVYQQVDANTAPTTPVRWNAGVFLVTANTADAGLITLSGGGLAGSVPLQDDGNGEWFVEFEYETQAAMNAEFPGNATYTLVLSGGALGLQVQQLSVGTEQYPVIPVLDATSWNATQQYPAGVATTLNWNNPGPLTQASGLTVLDIEDRMGNVGYSSVVAGAATSATVPANALVADECHYGWLEFTSDVQVPASGFAVPGTVHHGRAIDFELRTWPYATAPCAWYESYGAGCANLELDSTDPMLGSSWDLTTYGLASPTAAVTYFSTGPLEPGVPMNAFGLDAPGCLVYLDLFSVVADFGGVSATGQLTVSIPLPASQNFGGMLFYAQTVALTPLTPVGLGTSNVIEAMVGS